MTPPTPMNAPAPNSLWLVIVECQPNVIRVCSSGRGFYIPGQEPCWGFSHVDKWIMEIPPDGFGNHLTRKKAKQVLAAEQGSEITGVVICCPDGRRAIVEMSAVRWLDGDGAWDLMHPTPVVDQAREDRLREGLANLAAWANARAHGVHNVETTLTMLHRKVTDLRAAVAKAGQRAAAPADLEECIVVHFRGDPARRHRLTFQQFHALKNSGMLWEFYPDAPAVWPNDPAQAPKAAP